MFDSFHQQTHRLHEVVIVQERFALSHEDQVDAVALHLDLLIAEHRQNLSHDFARTQVAVQAEKSSHAEGTFDRAANLAGDADGRALPASLALGSLGWRNAPLAASRRSLGFARDDREGAEEEEGERSDRG